MNANRSDYERQVMAVKCPYCGAEPQAECIDEEGRITRPHHARHLVFQREGHAVARLGR